MLHRKWFMRPLCVVLSTLLSFPVIAAEAVVADMNARPQVMDVQLREDGSMLGKLVDRQGQALPNVAVQLLNKRGDVLTAKTNADGVFQGTGIAAGELAVRVANETQMVRVWNAQMAPPSAAPGALFVVGDAVRGQCCPQQQTCCPQDCGPLDCGPACGGCYQCGGSGPGGWFGNGGFGHGGFGHGLLARPWLLGAGVAAAIAIPLALDDDDAS